VGDKSRFEAALADVAELQTAADGRVEIEVQTISDSAVVPTQAGEGPTRIAAAIRRAALSRVYPNRLILLTDGRDSERRHLAPVGEELASHKIELDVRIYGSESAPSDSGITAEPARNVIRLGEEIVVQGAV